MALHGAAVLGLFTLFHTSLVEKSKAPPGHTTVVWAPAPTAIHSAGGGGQRDSLPASLGNLPPRSRHRPLMPFMLRAVNPNPRLAVEQALLIEPDIPVPRVAVDRLGSPFGVDGPFSGGRGGPGGIGDGGCCGVGNQDGNGVQGAGPAGGARTTPAHARPPVLLYKTEPEYSEEARKAKVQGVVVLTAEVDENGRLRRIVVTRSLGLGLDEQAVAALAHWRFRPATANGRPVPFSVTIEVNFRLL